MFINKIIYYLSIFCKRNLSALISPYPHKDDNTFTKVIIQLQNYNRTITQNCRFKHAYFA